MQESNNNNQGSKKNTGTEPKPERPVKINTDSGDKRSMPNEKTEKR